ncbi:uncharacterized protein LOC120340098 [Styela clava]
MDEMPDCTDTGNFASALANLLSTVSRCSPADNPILQKLNKLQKKDDNKGNECGTSKNENDKGQKVDKSDEAEIKKNPKRRNKKKKKKSTKTKNSGGDNNDGQTKGLEVKQGKGNEIDSQKAESSEDFIRMGDNSSQSQDYEAKETGEMKNNEIGQDDNGEGSKEIHTNEKYLIKPDGQNFDRSEPGKCSADEGNDSDLSKDKIKNELQNCKGNEVTETSSGKHDNGIECGDNTKKQNVCANNETIDGKISLENGENVKHCVGSENKEQENCGDINKSVGIESENGDICDRKDSDSDGKISLENGDNGENVKDHVRGNNSNHKQANCEAVAKSVEKRDASDQKNSDKRSIGENSMNAKDNNEKAKNLESKRPEETGLTDEPSSSAQNQQSKTEPEASSTMKQQKKKAPSHEGDSDTTSSSSDDEDYGSTEGISAFTRLDLEGMLKKATQRVNLRKLFKPGQFEAQCAFQKRRIVRLENKCTLLLELGLPLPPEDILREKMGLRRLNMPSIESSDSDSDEDWGPSGSSRKKKKMPVFRGISENDTKLRMEFIKKYVEDRQTGKAMSVPPPPSKRESKPQPRRVIVTKKEEPKFEPFKKSESGDASSRYDTRRKTGVKYTEEYVPEDDHFVFCDECKALHLEDCPDHPSMRMKDTLVKIGIKDRAKHTCPPGLSIDPSQIRNGGLGVWCEIDIPQNTVFGPYEGDIVKKYDVKNLVKVSEGGYSWQIYKKDKLSHYIDGSNIKTSNWLRYVNCARNEEEQNLIAFQYKGQIYYRTFKHVKRNVELFVWYGSHYASQMGIASKPSRDKALKINPVKANIMSIKKSTSITEYKLPPLPDNVISDFTNSTKSPNCEAKNASEKIGNAKSSKSMRKAQCPQCLTWFSSYAYVQLHVKTVHENQKIFECTICGRGSTCKANLLKHLRIHTGEKPYKCDVCGDRFARSDHLQAHQRTHSGERPYKCEVCGDRFNRRGNLRTHHRTHTGEKPYKCEVCGGRFAYSGHLRRHHRTHTGEKPYKCEVCGERFAQSSSRSGHVKKYHCKTKE